MKNMIFNCFFIFFLIGFNVLGQCANGYEFFDTNSTKMLSFVENYSNFSQSAVGHYTPLYVGLTLIRGAAAKGAGGFSVFGYLVGFLDLDLHL
ncbi:hypothetical protein Hdeb2414_s0017g00508871 [Helianthus debilis subsp. tardiflorus]